MFRPFLTFALAASVSALIVVAVPAAGQTGSRAKDVAGNAGRIIGAAQICGVEYSRLDATMKAAFRSIESLASSADERVDALLLYSAARAAGAVEQRGPNPRETCGTVRGSFRGIERLLAGR
jgi:hypothetical protein